MQNESCPQNAWADNISATWPQKVNKHFENERRIPLDVLGAALQIFSRNLQVNQAVKQTSSTLLICKYFKTILCMLLLKLLLPLMVSALF